MYVSLAYDQQDMVMVSVVHNNAARILPCREDISDLAIYSESQGYDNLDCILVP